MAKKVNGHVYYYIFFKQLINKLPKKKGRCTFPAS